MSRTWRSVLMMWVAMTLVGCTGGAMSGSPSIPSDTPGTATTPAPSTPVATPTATAPTLVPSLPPMAPTALDPVMALRVDIRPDVSFGRVPTLTAYRDGTVLRRSDRGGEILRLSADGLARLLAAAAGSGLLERSGDIGPDPSYQAGYTTYSIAFQRSGALVERSVVNAYPASRRAEAERLIALAERLATPETWLPAGAWVSGPAATVRWIPDRYFLDVVDWGYLPDVREPVDVADVAWPLDTGLLEVGQAVELPALGPAAARCAVLQLVDARRVEAALVAALGAQRIPSEVRIPAEHLGVDLAWTARSSWVSIGLYALLPDDPSDCSLDRSWP